MQIGRDLPSIQRKPEAQTTPVSTPQVDTKANDGPQLSAQPKSDSINTSGVTSDAVGHETLVAQAVDVDPIAIDDGDIDWGATEVTGTQNMTVIETDFGNTDGGVNGSLNGDGADNLTITGDPNNQLVNIDENSRTEYVGDNTELRIIGAGDQAPVDANGNPLTVVGSDATEAAIQGNQMTVLNGDELASPDAANHYGDVTIGTVEEDDGSQTVLLESRNDANSSVPGTSAGLANENTAILQNNDGTVVPGTVNGPRGNQMSVTSPDGQTGNVQTADSATINIRQEEIDQIRRDGSVSETTSETTQSTQDRQEIRHEESTELREEQSSQIRNELETEERTVEGLLDAEQVTVTDGAREFTNEYEQETVTTEEFSVEEQEPMDNVDMQGSIPYLEQVPVTDANGEETGELYDYVTPRTDTNQFSVDSNGQANFLHQAPLNEDGNVQGRVGATVDVPNEQITIQGGITVTNDQTVPIMRDPDGDGVYSPVEASGEVLETRRPGLFNSGTPVREVVVDDYVAPDGTVYKGGHMVEDIGSENGPVVDGYVDATIAAYGQNVEVTERTYETETRVNDEVVDTYQQSTRTTDRTPGVVPFSNTFQDTNSVTYQDNFNDTYRDTYDNTIQDNYRDTYANTTTTTQTDNYSQTGINPGSGEIWNNPQFEGSTVTSSSASDLIGSDLTGSNVISSDLTGSELINRELTGTDRLGSERVGSELINSETGEFQATGPTSSNTIDIGDPSLINRNVDRTVTQETRQIDEESWTEFQLGMNGNVEAGLNFNLDSADMWLNPNRFNDDPESRNENLNIRPTSEATFEDYQPAGPPAGSVNSNRLNLNIGADIPIAGRQPGDNNNVRGYVGAGANFRLAGETHTPQVVYADGTSGPRYRTQPAVGEDGQPVYQEINGEQYQVMEYETYPEGHPKAGHPIPFERVAANGEAFMLELEGRQYFDGETQGRAELQYRF